MLRPMVCARFVRSPCRPTGMLITLSLGKKRTSQTFMICKPYAVDVTSEKEQQCYGATKLERERFAG
ncbi:hypothetical protein LCGC14_2086810, partial [marine sediment metagenome]